ncbi:methyltransferase family protein [Babesia bovis T2Bo]|uniref:methyltransferase family protein n=1 Tax=Babesia bovis T2Bo TaxID=484906 RepID=UPI001D62A517|nr:methyltransferase family protein [Babesia bovis T2Bo]EDO07144.2 methyltransferase family protein [Babesia bovis T2Bo]
MEAKISKKRGTSTKKRNLLPFKNNREFSLQCAKKRLSGSRFRTLNERLYTSHSRDNYSYYQRNPTLFKIYHEGYREQVEKWPIDPLNKILVWLEGIEDDQVIGDFGCGEARIAQTFINRKVHSFDLIAGNSFITSCNISKVPLDDNSLDICLFCLSLMGKDWPLFIREATRCLKVGGILKIVEVSSRFTDINKFNDFFNLIGYNNEEEMEHDENDIFTFFQFRLQTKQKTIPGDIYSKISDVLLPCLYKRR